MESRRNGPQLSSRHDDDDDDVTSGQSRIEEVGELYFHFPSFPSPPISSLPFPILSLSLLLPLEVGPLKYSQGVWRSAATEFDAF